MKQTVSQDPIKEFPICRSIFVYTLQMVNDFFLHWMISDFNYRWQFVIYVHFSSIEHNIDWSARFDQDSCWWPTCGYWTTNSRHAYAIYNQRNMSDFGRNSGKHRFSYIWCFKFGKASRSGWYVWLYLFNDSVLISSNILVALLCNIYIYIYIFKA